MSVLNSILRTSMEDAGLVEPTSDVIPQQADSIEEAELDTSAAEVEAIEGEVAAEETAADQMVVAAESLQRVYDRMAYYAENGGVSQEAADFMNLAVHNALAPVGMESLTSMVPSMESFGTASGANSGLRVAMESVSETLKKWWEAIKKFFADMYKKMVEFFRRIFTFEGRLRARAQKVLERARDAGKKTGADSTEKVSVTGRAEYCFRDGTVKDKLRTQLKIITDSLSSLSTSTDETEKTVSQIADLFDNKDLTVEEIFGQYVRNRIMKTVIEVKKFKKDSKVDGEKLVINHPAGIDGYFLQVSAPARSDSDDLDISTLSRLKYEVVKGKDVTYKSEAKLTPIPRKELIESANAAYKLVLEGGMIRKLNSNFDKTEKKVKNALSKRLDDREAGWLNKAAGKRMVSVVFSMMRDSASAGTKLYAHSLNIAKDTLDYIEKSIDAHNKK